MQNESYPIEQRYKINGKYGIKHATLNKSINKNTYKMLKNVVRFVCYFGEEGCYFISNRYTFQYIHNCVLNNLIFIVWIKTFVHTMAT